MNSADPRAARPPTRRAFVARAAALPLAGGVVSALFAPSAAATPDAMRAAIREVTGGAIPREGRITLDLPPLVENGNAVPLTVSVESPMTAADHVRAIHVFNEKNPQPHVFAATIGPRAGRAVISTRIKLGDSQRIVAIAETSDGVFWTAGADVIVTLAACLEELT